MKLVGFNFTKIGASRAEQMKRPTISTNMEFVDVQKEKVDLLENEVIRISFKHDLMYADPDNKKESLGEINFEGRVALAVDKEESKEVMKAWKKKRLPDKMELSLTNLILRKCTPKAVTLQDQIELPHHIPMPKASRQ